MIFSKWKMIFPKWKTVFPKWKKTCSPPCKSTFQQPENRFSAFPKTVLEKNILHFACSKLYHLVPFCPRNQIFTIKEGGVHYRGVNNIF